MPDMYPEDQLFSSSITLLPPKKTANHDPHPKNRPNSDHIPNKSHSDSAILEHIPINPH